jgi:hypothetical protein
MPDPPEDVPRWQPPPPESEEVPRWQPPAPTSETPRWQPPRGPAETVPRWEPDREVPRWEPPDDGPAGALLEGEMRARRAAAPRVSPFLLPFVWWSRHPWVVVWACVFLTPGAVLLLRALDEYGFDTLVFPLEILFTAFFAFVLLRGVLFSARRALGRLGLGLVGALAAVGVLLWPVTQVTLGRVTCPPRAGTELGVQSAAVALEAWQRGEAGDAAWHGGEPDPAWRDKAKGLSLLDYQLVDTGCWERVAPIDGGRTWHDFRVTVKDGERAPLSKVVTVRTAAEGGGWKITGIEGPLP